MNRMDIKFDDGVLEENIYFHSYALKSNCIVIEIEKKRNEKETKILNLKNIDKITIYE